MEIKTDEQKRLFIEQNAVKLRPIDRMYKIYGKSDASNKCSTCDHLFAHAYSKTYWKCDLYKVTGGPATDFRRSWQACGRYAELKVSK